MTKKQNEEKTCKCGKPLSECGCKDGKCGSEGHGCKCEDGEGDCSKEEGCCGGHDHDSHPEITIEQMTHSLNVLMNALISLMVEKKMITEQELHDKLIKDFGVKPSE